MIIEERIVTNPNRRRIQKVNDPNNTVDNFLADVTIDGEGTVDPVGTLITADLLNNLFDAKANTNLDNVSTIAGAKTFSARPVVPSTIERTLNAVLSLSNTVNVGTNTAASTSSARNYGTKLSDGTIINYGYWRGDLKAITFAIPFTAFTGVNAVSAAPNTNPTFAITFSTHGDSTDGAVCHVKTSVVSNTGFTGIHSFAGKSTSGPQPAGCLAWYIAIGY